MSRCYGYYECDCGRTWRSAYTWCFHSTFTPEYGQDCQRCHAQVFACRVEKLLAPATNERRNDDLSKNHNQALCHKCRNKAFPCSSKNNYHSNSFYNYTNGDDKNDSESEEDEDDDLYIAIKNSSNQNNNKENIIDLCSPDSDINNDDAISIMSHQDQHEYTEYTQFTEAQTAVELTPNNVFTQYCSQPQSAYICNRNMNMNNNRKRSRNQMEYQDSDDHDPFESSESS
eukprot:UN08542